MSISPVHKDTLKPLSQSGGEKLLQLVHTHTHTHLMEHLHSLAHTHHQEISRLEEEKQRLQQRLQSVETKVTSAARCHGNTN